MGPVSYDILISGRHLGAEAPDECPICHRQSEIALVTTNLTHQDSSLEVIFRCGYRGCRSCFICYYGKLNPNQPANVPLKLLQVRPQKPSPAQFPDSVKTLSLDFVTIFNQAKEAKHLGLAQIAGPGFRKALEFLVKDYAISRDQDKKDQIEADSVGKVIEDAINHPKIRELAKRSAWLGNDETHYRRKWETHDIDDFVAIITLTTNWIDVEIMSQKVIDSMPKKL